MIKTSIEKIAKDIGFDIGMSDDRVQQDLLNGLGEAFSKYNDREFDMQLSYVSRGLNEKAKKLIKELNEYL